MKVYTIANKKSHRWAITKLESIGTDKWPPIFMTQNKARLWLSTHLNQKKLQDFVKNYKIVTFWEKG